MAKFGFSIENVTEKAKELLDFYSKNPVPALDMRPNF